MYAKKIRRYEAIPLYIKGLADGEIAKKLGVSRVAIVKWRAKNNLPTKYCPTVSDKPRIMSLYNQGLSDGKLGDALGISRIAILKWRQRNNLPSNFQKIA